MRRTITTVATLLVALPLFAHDGHNRNISVDGDRGPLTSCDQLHISFDDEDAKVVSEDVQGVSGLSALKIDAKSNGGISVVGWDESRYAVTACKATGASLDPSSIHVTLRGNEVTSDAADDDTMVYYIVRAPRSANLDLAASNGPVSVHETGGSITAHSKNGPISLKNVDGAIDAAATNGPISYAGERGTVKLHAENGPISIKLSGTSWQGGSFDASTSNGPLTVKLPRGYASSVVVDAAGHGPVSCKADACGSANVSFDRRGRARSESEDFGPRHFEFGSGPSSLHFTTSNGPLSIKDAE